MMRRAELRELVNDFAAVLDAAARGETVVVTRDGTPVAELRPIRRRRFVPTVELKRALDPVRPVDFAAMRAEMDALDM